MNEEKSESASIISLAGETAAVDEHIRRPWHKPPITRIEIKRTMLGTGSLNDGEINASSTG